MATFRFPIPHYVLESPDFISKLNNGVSCTHQIGKNYLQLSGDYLHLDLFSGISEEFHHYLLSATRSNPSLMVNSVEIGVLAPELAIHTTRSFCLEYPRMKAIGTPGYNGSQNLLIIAGSIHEVTDMFEVVAPGLFLKSSFLSPRTLSKLGFFTRLRLLFNFGW